MDTLQNKISQITKTLVDTPTKKAVLVIGSILLVLALLIHYKKIHIGTVGFPCYCKECEIKAAQNGDPEAQIRLTGGQYSGLWDKAIGPLVFVVGFLILFAIVYKLPSPPPYVGQFFDQELRGR